MLIGRSYKSIHIVGSTYLDVLNKLARTERMEQIESNFSGYEISGGKEDVLELVMMVTWLINISKKDTELYTLKG
jgi:hypothetical protein